MFSRGNKNNEPKKLIQEPPAPPSIISRDLKIIGNLISDGEIQIDGTVTGDIRTKNLMVGETAVIKGEITAQMVRVHGSIDGQIKAHAVQLAKTAYVVGDILHEDLAIETGAFLEGHCKRIEMPDTKPSQPSASELTNLKTTPAASTLGKPVPATSK